MDREILERYKSREGAQSYSRKFRKHWNERLNDWSEQRLVRGLLGRVAAAGACGVALDTPCGYGRLYPALRGVAVAVVECDVSRSMLEIAMAAQASVNGAPGPAAEYIQASALELPFADRRFDLVLSVRLCHHIREPDERRRYVREVLRVSRRWVLFTYFDAGSLKNRLRELRRRLSARRAKWTLGRSEVREIAAGEGFEVVRSVALSRLFSGHRYTLLCRKPGGREP